MNTLKTTFLLAALTAVFIVVGNLIGGQSGMIIALALAGIMNFVSYWWSDKIVLMRYRAEPLSREDAPKLYSMVEDLTARASMPMPKLYLLPSESPNAFATGRNPEHAAVAVTQGLMDLMDYEEVQGVVAHELSHIRHRDTLIGTVAATLAGAVMVLANMARWGAILGGGSRDNDGGSIIGLLATAIVAPIAAMLIQMAISRSREFKADAGAAEITGNPNGLASALKKLKTAGERIPLKATQSTAHMFIYQPFLGTIGRLFSTHPPIEERVRRLIG